MSDSLAAEKPGGAIATLLDQPRQYADRTSWGKQKAIALLLAAGLTRQQVAEELDLTQWQVNSALKKQENRELMEMLREAMKAELTASGLALQRKYLDGLRDMPVDRKHASAHRAIVEALSKIYDKTAHAAGEATERTESKSLVITMSDRTERVRRLRESRQQRQERERDARDASA